MMNMKNGKIRSVGVRPNHSACCRGAYVASSGPPGLFTKIMPAMVIPRRMSIDVIRCFLGFASIVVGFAFFYLYSQYFFESFLNASASLSITGM